MYQPMLFLHWKQIRMVLALLVVASFGLPLLAVEGLGTPPGMDTGSLEAYRLVLASQTWAVFFPVLAAAIGIILGLSAWNWDHQLNHIYPLSLPLTRWEYTMLKMGAGVTLALLPVVGMWIGAHLATAFLTLPAGLNAYPNELTIRFLFAIVFFYGLMFAMAAGTIKTTIWVMGTFVGLVLFALLGNDLLANYYDFFVRVNVVDLFFEWMVEAPGPFQVITGSWSLIDV